MHQSQKGTAMSVAKMCDLAQHVASKVQFLHGRDLNCCNQVHGSVEAKTTVLVAIKWRSWSICQSQGELQGLPSLKHAASKDVVKHGSWIFATWSMSFEANKENTFWRAVQWHPWSMYLRQKKKVSSFDYPVQWHWMTREGFKHASMPNIVNDDAGQFLPTKKACLIQSMRPVMHLSFRMDLGMSIPNFVRQLLTTIKSILHICNTLVIFSN